MPFLPNHVMHKLLSCAALLSLPALGYCDELNSGDTAWMLTASLLVLFMTLPGLALFYGGLVRSKNVLSILVQCFAMAGIMSIIWVIYGYSLAFGMPAPDANGEHGMLAAVIGNFEYLFLSGIQPDDMNGSIPFSIWVVFQMTFAIITPAIIAGAFAERIKFSAMIIFSVLWVTVSYLPICHMAWAGEGALFHGWGVLDFAGGTVVHINAGIAALVAAIYLGKRRGYPEEPLKPHNLTMTLTGAAMLWVGWFGFNAGSEVAADGVAGMAMLVTQLCTAVGAVTWMLIEWIKHGKPSALGIASGAVAGLVGITPACGTVGIPGAFAIGVLSALLCYIAIAVVKQKCGYDDSLDAFGIHGVGGIVGAVLTGAFASSSLGGFEDIESIGAQVWWQTASVLVTIVWSGVSSFIILFLIDKTIGLRVSSEDEDRGLDLSLHDERGYIM